MDDTETPKTCEEKLQDYIGYASRLHDEITRVRKTFADHGETLADGDISVAIAKKLAKMRDDLANAYRSGNANTLAPAPAARVPEPVVAYETCDAIIGAIDEVRWKFDRDGANLRMRYSNDERAEMRVAIVAVIEAATLETELAQLDARRGEVVVDEAMVERGNVEARKYGLRIGSLMIKQILTAALPQEPA